MGHNSSHRDEKSPSSGHNQDSAAGRGDLNHPKSSTLSGSDSKKDKFGGGEKEYGDSSNGEMIELANGKHVITEYSSNAAGNLPKKTNMSVTSIIDEKATLLLGKGEKEDGRNISGKPELIQTKEKGTGEDNDGTASKENTPLLQQIKGPDGNGAGSSGDMGENDFVKDLRRSMLLDSNAMSLYGSAESAVKKGGLHLKWSNVKYSVKTKNEDMKLADVPILHNAFGEAKPGEMIGIIGGSGAGKTSLLNILSGRISTGKPTGSVSINGKRRDPSWRWITSYVEQDDHLFPMLTVRETFTFVAMMKSPKGLSKKEKLARVEQLMRTLGLLHIADSRIGDVLHRGISGGERKRVSIGIELITNPKLIFLDEPTSGLDALTALSVMETIKNLTVNDGITAIVTIHQPRLEISSLFSKIILLSQGHMIFFGHVTEAIKHFEDQGYPLPEYENPTDFFIDVITVDKRTPESTEEGEERLSKLIKACRRSQQYQSGCGEKEDRLPTLPSRLYGKSGQETTAEQQRFNADGDLAAGERRLTSLKYARPISFVEETYYLAKRDFTNAIRDSSTRKWRAGATLFSTATLCVVFFRSGTDYAGLQNRLGLLFVIIVRSFALTMNPLITSLNSESSVVARERYSFTYRVLPYFTAKFLTALPESMAYTVFQCVLVYYIAGLRTDGFYHFLETLAILLLSNICAASFAFCIVASSPSREIIEYAFSTNGTLMAIFGSSFSSSTSITWIFAWLKYLCIAYYPYQALTQNELSGQTFSGVPGASYLSLYGLNQMNFGYVCVALATYTLITFWGGYLSLLFRAKPKIVLI